jgi:hypothetical protein
VEKEIKIIYKISRKVGGNNTNANDNNNPLLSMENFNYGFGSNSANLEYSVLSNMLGSPLTDPTNAITSSSPIQTSTDVLNNIWSQQSPVVENVSQPIGMIRGDTSFLSSATQLASTPTSSYISTNNKSNTPNNNNNSANNNININTGTASNNMVNNINNSKGPITSVSSSTIGTSEISASGVSSLSAYGDGAVVAKVASPVTASTGPAVRRRNQIITPEMVYASATKPFSYADGYHYLINYVKSR